MAKARDTDTDFEEFVTARGARLLRTAWLLTGDEHLAEDLLQTVLAKVWPKWRRLSGENPEAYIRKALVNTYASWWQRRWRGEIPHDDVPEKAATEDQFASVDLKQALSLIVRQLPPRSVPSWSCGISTDSAWRRRPRFWAADRAPSRARRPGR
jgi:DNA-directed RNA polymerase specialized sigma24 family protein